MAQVGIFVPKNPSKSWNEGKGEPLSCPGCEEDTLMTIVYANGTIIVDCADCGCVWEFVAQSKEK